MISVINDNDGKIIAYIEWEIVNGEGQFQDNGEYCYIQDYWVHKEYRIQSKYILKKLSVQIAEHKFSKSMRWVYWCRHKYNDRLSRLYPKEKFLKGA